MDAAFLPHKAPCGLRIEARATYVDTNTSVHNVDYFT